jgi:hypothetical protein
MYVPYFLSLLSLPWLELELRLDSAQARKRGEGAYEIIRGSQVFEITSFPFEMSAKTRESFD